MIHSCEEWDKVKDIELRVDIPWYGPSITRIEYVKEHKRWIAHCDEYASIIKYCPFCGEQLPLN